MGSIRSSIELQDNFTNVLMSVINAVNMSVFMMEQMQSVMSEPIDTAGVQGIRDQLAQATIAARELDVAMQNLEAPSAGVDPAPVILPVEPSAPDPLVDQPDPVEVPVVWQSDNLEVFTNSGIERFEMEVQSANSMLDTLNNTQAQIAARAAQINIFPPGMVADMNGMQSRLQEIQSRIRAIESNPLNMGTDMANAELEQLRARLDQAVQAQENLNQAVEDMDVRAANESYLRLSQTIGGTERHIRDNVDEQGRFNREIQEGTGEANQLMQAIKGAVADYASFQTFTKVMELSDQMVSTTARLDMMNDGLQTTKELQDMIFLSAERARGSYQGTADAVSKLGLMAGNAFSSSGEIIAFVEQVNKQFVIAGTEASGVEAAMLQLTQAMGSGVLRGEEYNSILEQAPNIVQSIAGYIEGNGDVLAAVAAAMDMEVEALAGNVQGTLKDIASEGLISAEMVKAAMFYAADETNAKFEGMPKTFEQIWISFQNNAMMAFQPVLQRMNEIANSEAFQEFVDNAISALSVVAGIALEIFDLLVGVAGAVADNWSWLSPIIYGVAAALIAYCTALSVYNGIQAISNGLKKAAAFAEQVHAASIAMSTGATFAATAAQYGFNAALLACPLTWIIILIVAVIVVLYAVVAAINKVTGSTISATGIICGAVAAAGAFLLDTAIGVINAILQAVWSFADPFISIVEWILNVANGGFDSFGGAVANLIGQIISWFLLLGMVVTRIIDAIFGTDWTSGLSALQDNVLSWGKNENAITLERSAPMIDYRIGIKDAWDAGYSFGERIDESIANFDMASLFDTNIPNPEDYADLGNYTGWTDLDGIGSGVNDIAGNTGAIADALDITGEELKYLRDIAEQEAINRFTTAEINIEQTNHNTIKNGMDLDGIMSGMTDMVNEAIDISTEGVHA